jgi:chemotaxis signal transduction protein
VRLPRYKRRVQRSAGLPVILFTVGDHLFAIGAAGVNEIQNTDGLQPLKGPSWQFSKVRHTLVRETRRYWVVDANIHFGMMPTRNTRVLLLDGSPVALKVDSIVRMTEVAKVLPLPQSFTGEERNWYQGLTLIDDTVVPVVNPEALLSQYDMTALEQSATPLVTEAAGATA